MHTYRNLQKGQDSLFLFNTVGTKRAAFGLQCNYILDVEQYKITAKGGSVPQNVPLTVQMLRENAGILE